MSCEQLIDLSRRISGYQIDSRNVSSGNLFFAIQGERHDGHDFLLDVQRRGAFGAVISKDVSVSLIPDFPLFRVPNVGECLRELARRTLQMRSMKVIGVTGSVGKTTTKDFIATLLDRKYRVAKTLKSQNSKLTLPLTILNAPGDTEVLVLEMGMSEPGDIARHVSIAPPDVAVLTKVGLAHAAFFPGGIEQITMEKRAIFSHPKTAIKICDLACAQGEWTFSSVDPRADFFLGDLQVPFLEAHLRHNCSAAIATAIKMGLSLEEILLRLPDLETPPMRCEELQLQGVCFINDAYNANPDSMRAALDVVSRRSGTKIAVLGSMKELGDFSKTEHQSIGEYARSRVDYLFTFGEEAIHYGGEHFSSFQTMVDRLKEVALPGDSVLLKGSRSMQMEQVLCFFGS